MRPIRPSSLVRACALLLTVGVAVPVHAAAAGGASTAKPSGGTTPKAAQATKSGQTAKPAPTQRRTTATQQRKPAARKATPAKKPAASTQAARDRQARLAKARAEARARELARMQALQEAMTPRFKTDESGVLVPDVRAAAAIVFNPETGEVVWGENTEAKRSIASITKVMTAVVFLENDPDLSRKVTIERSDVFAASTTFLQANDRVSLNDLLHLTLIASDNAAARALARVSPLGSAAFIERMNEKALDLGLENTTFADPSGLNPNNISTAYDVSRLITFASADERIAPMMRMTSHKITLPRRVVSINNTNHLVRGGEIDVMGGKTGFISRAGYCLATLLRLPQGQQVAVVVLGAGSNPGRFWETRHLFNWLSEKATDLFAASDHDLH